MTRIIIGATILIMAVTIGLVNGCTVGDLNRPEELKPIEISEYEGEKLSSIGDFRENSLDMVVRGY